MTDKLYVIVKCVERGRGRIWEDVEKFPIMITTDPTPYFYKYGYDVYETVKDNRLLCIKDYGCDFPKEECDD
jgi:hypothetical protein